MTGRVGGDGAPPTRAGWTRLILLGAAATLAGLDLAAKSWAEQSLVVGRVVSGGPIQLRLAHNSGVAFSLGDRLPAAAVLMVTGAIIAGVTVVAWRAAGRTAGRTRVLSLISWAAVLGGAVGNFADRVVDGVVTDYLHTGWFPTFNGADVLITLGAAGLLLATFAAGAPPVVSAPAHRDPANPDPASSDRVQQP